MCLRKTPGAGSIWLLALVLAAACNSQPGQTVTAPPENVPDSISMDSVAAQPLPEQSEHTHTIEISKMKFNPDELMVHAGDTVVWVNKDMTNHCITEDSKAWTSSPLVPGQSWKKVITASTNYYCAIHLVMKGRIAVE